LGSLGEEDFVCKILLQASFLIGIGKKLNCLGLTPSFGYNRLFGMKLHWNWLQAFEGGAQ
jgi:hypothetical protein